MRREINADDERRKALLGVRGLRKRFREHNRERLLFDIERIEIATHGAYVLTGINGAGKSTLMKLLGGAARPDAGTIEIDGRACDLTSPQDARRAGIAVIYQEFNLVPYLTVGENIYLGREPRAAIPAFVDFKKLYADAQQVMDKLKVKIDVRAPVHTLSVAQQQMVEIARNLIGDCHVLIFDEPTRGIDVGAKYEIYLLMNELAARGKAIIMISSELPEVLGMSDRILVLHEGRVTGEITDVRNATQEQIMGLAIA